MTKFFKVERKDGKLMCPELPGYKLPKTDPGCTPIAIQVEMQSIRTGPDACEWMHNQFGCTKDCCTCYKLVPVLSEDGTVKGDYIEIKTSSKQSYLIDSMNSEYRNLLKSSRAILLDIVMACFYNEENPDEPVKVGPFQRDVEISEVNNKDLNHDQTIQD